MTGLEAEVQSPWQHIADSEAMAKELDAIVPDADGSRKCRCGAIIATTGWAAHRGRHIRQGTYEPPPSPTTKKRKYTKRQTPAVDDACLALLAGLVGDKIPLSMIGDVQTWVADTKKLIEALK